MMTSYYDKKELIKNTVRGKVKALKDRYFNEKIQLFFIKSCILFCSQPHYPSSE